MKTSTLKPRLTSINMRNSNIELYRIIAMLLIVAHHYVVNSGLTSIGGPICSNLLAPKSLFLSLFGAWGKIGINCFVLISGYFMCQSRITAKKFAKLFFEVMFYRIIISSLFWISGYQPFSFISLIKTIIPFTKIADNFTGTYLIFFLSIPFLNILIHNLNEKQHILLVCLASFIYIFFGTFPFFTVKMNYISWFMVLYFIASYIRLYPRPIFSNGKLWGIATAICFILCIISIIGCTWLKRSPYYFVTDSNTFLAVAMGLSSFLFFKNINIKPNKFINAIAATTFGILLIHANSDVMRKWLWQDILNNVGMYHSRWIYLHAVLSVIIVFAVCSLIDSARIHFIEKPFFRLWDRLSAKVSPKLNSIGNTFWRKLKIDSPNKK